MADSSLLPSQFIDRSPSHSWRGQILYQELPFSCSSGYLAGTPPVDGLSGSNPSGRKTGDCPSCRLFGKVTTQRHRINGHYGVCREQSDERIRKKLRVTATPSQSPPTVPTGVVPCSAFGPSTSRITVARSRNACAPSPE
jgi:hypothetical protein